MKRLLLLTFFVLSFAICAHAQTPTTTQNARRLPNGSGAPSGSCVAGPPFIQTYIDSSTTPPTTYYCKAGTWTASSGGATAAPKDATYITQTPNATLTNEQALSALATGILKNTTTTGVLSISSVTDDVQTKASIVPNTAPSAGQILAGNAGGTAYAPVTLSGSGVTATLSSAGLLTLSAIPSATLNLTTTTCTNQFVTAISSGGVGTCTSATLAGAQFANQGTTATVLHGNAAGNPSFGAVALGTDVSGTLAAAQEPAHTGDVTNSAGSLALSIAANAVTLAKLATQATNTVLGNATSGTAVPTALAIGTCSTSGSALIWTTNTGFGCNTSMAANTAATLLNARTIGGVSFNGSANITVSSATAGFTVSGGTLVSGIQTMSVGNTTSASTDLLINPTTKASGNLLDAQVNGASKFSVDYLGTADMVKSGVGTGDDSIATARVTGSGTGMVSGGSDAAQDLFIEGTNSTTNVANLTIASNSAVATGNGGCAGFGSKYSGNSWALHAKICGSKATSGSALGGGLNFYTRPDAGNNTLVFALGSAGTITLNTGVTNAAGTPGSICYNTSTFEMTKNNALTCTVSSRNFKQNILGLPESASNAFDRLRPVQFSYRDQPNRSRYGFISEEAGAADQRFADGYDAANKNPTSLDQNAILAATVAEVQKLKHKVKRLNHEKTITHHRSVRRHARAN